MLHGEYDIIATLELLVNVLGVNVAPKTTYLCKLQLLDQNFFQCYLLVFHAVCGPEELLVAFIIAAMITGDVTGLRSCLLSRVLSFKCLDCFSGEIMRRELSFPFVYTVVHVGFREWPHCIPVMPLLHGVV